jgi:hypothetical protein
VYDDYYKNIFVDVGYYHFDNDFVVEDKDDHWKKMVDEQVIHYHLLVHYNNYLDYVMFELNAYLMAIVVENDWIGIAQYYLMKNHRKICFY